MSSQQEIDSAEISGHLMAIQNRGKASRTTAVYWKHRLERTTSSTGFQNALYSIRIGHQKRRERFPLNSSNKNEAAILAAEIFSFLIGNGWEITLRKYKTEGETVNDPSAKLSTVGDLIQSACNHSTARDQTKAEYAKALRRIVSGVMGFEFNKKFNSRNHSGNTQWHSAVDSVPLSELTPTKIQTWRSQFLAAVTSDEAAKRRAIITTNSLIRNAKGLFAKKILPFLGDELELPTPLPFEGIPLIKQPSMRYSSKINARQLLESAASDLKPQNQEAYKILLLALMCGLRVSEIDYLLWDAFDFERCVLRVEDTEYHRLKSEDSAGEIDLNESMTSFFCDLQNEASGHFVIESNQELTRTAGSRRYRCSRHLNDLRKWLRSNGVTSNRPIHELRKEVGSIIANEQGIFAASRYLRHSDIRITSSIYADKKKKITPAFLIGNNL